MAATYFVQAVGGRYVVSILDDAGNATDISQPFDSKNDAKALRDLASAQGVGRLADAVKPEPAPEPVKVDPVPAKPAAAVVQHKEHPKPALVSSKKPHATRRPR